MVVEVMASTPDGTRILGVASADSDQTAPTNADASTLVTSDPVLELTLADAPDPVGSGELLVYDLALDAGAGTWIRVF